jgi:long-chain fatty acid transport protein
VRGRIGLLVALSAIPSGVRAGGLEFPGNGTEALGRGAAFTAKADDATAVEYNVAGLARQRGTRLLVDANLILSSYSFQRAGAYPDDPANPATPWGGRAFPRVDNAGGPFVAPLGAISTDFGLLDRWTFALAVYGPSAAGNRTYPLGVGGLPSPSRYDFVQAVPLVVYPTLAAAVRAATWLDLGLALHVVVGRFDLTSVSYTDLGKPTCPNAEYQPCDSLTHLLTDGATATMSAGALVRPAPWIAFGVHVRGPWHLDTSGRAEAIAPRVAPMTIAPAPARFSTEFPWIVRAGLRFVQVRNGFEKADIELDATYESWGSVKDPVVDIPQLSLFKNIHTVIAHNYQDTFSLRLGAAYNVPISGGALSLRVGGFYDSSATRARDTRLDFDTREKWAGTFGIGYRIRGIAINISYAFLYSPERVVTDGALRPITVSSPAGTTLPEVNSGRYAGATQIVSMGLSVAWDELLQKQRRLGFAADWEERELGPRAPLPPPAPSVPPDAPDATPPAVTPPDGESRAEPDSEFEIVEIKQTRKKRRHHGRRLRVRAG